jgi:hypothetical protein
VNIGCTLASRARSVDTHSLCRVVVLKIVAGRLVIAHFFDPLTAEIHDKQKSLLEALRQVSEVVRPWRGRAAANIKT